MLKTGNGVCNLKILRLVYNFVCVAQPKIIPNFLVELFYQKSKYEYSTSWLLVKFCLNLTCIWSPYETINLWNNIEKTTHNMILKHCAVNTDPYNLISWYLNINNIKYASDWLNFVVVFHSCINSTVLNEYLPRWWHTLEAKDEEIV